MTDDERSDWANLLDEMPCGLDVQIPDHTGRKTVRVSIPGPLPGWQPVVYEFKMRSERQAYMLCSLVASVAAHGARSMQS